MAKNFKCVAAVLCEDIRQEIGNKHTIIGAWFGDLLLGELPGNVRLAVLIVLDNLTSGYHRAVAEIRLDKKAVASVSFDIEAKVGEVVMLTVPQGILAMATAADLTVSMSVDGGRMTTLISSKIRLGPALTGPNASPPPSEQSRTSVPEKASRRGKRHPSVPPADGGP